jgi:hypothetical protein
MKTMSEEDALNVLVDELKSYLVTIGISPNQIPLGNNEPKSILLKAKSMPEEQAYSYLVKEFKVHLSSLGVDQSVIHSLRFE